MKKQVLALLLAFAVPTHGLMAENQTLWQRTKERAVTAKEWVVEKIKRNPVLTIAVALVAATGAAIGGAALYKAFTPEELKLQKQIREKVKEGKLDDLLEMLKDADEDLLVRAVRGMSYDERENPVLKNALKIKLSDDADEEVYQEARKRRLEPWPTKPPRGIRPGIYREAEEISRKYFVPGEIEEIAVTKLSKNDTPEEGRKKIKAYKKGIKKGKYNDQRIENMPGFIKQVLVQANLILTPTGFNPTEANEFDVEGKAYERSSVGVGFERPWKFKQPSIQAAFYVLSQAVNDKVAQKRQKYAGLQDVLKQFNENYTLV